jgi:hypothetical protein
MLCFYDLCRDFWTDQEMAATPGVLPSAFWSLREALSDRVIANRRVRRNSEPAGRVAAQSQRKVRDEPVHGEELIETCEQVRKRNA